MEEQSKNLKGIKTSGANFFAGLSVCADFVIFIYFIFVFTNCFYSNFRSSILETFSSEYSDNLCTRLFDA